MKTKSIQKQFKRTESKYLIDKSHLEDLVRDLEPYMVADEYAQSQITNVYFDTEDFAMIRDALDKKYGREKVRMRLYDYQPSMSSQAFLEIKKKIEKVGYKYRLAATVGTIYPYIEQGITETSIYDEQVKEELSQLHQRYGHLKPKMYIHYCRTAFHGSKEKGLRLTIDQDLVYRDEHVAAISNVNGNYLVDPDLAIIELKFLGDMPEWLAQLLANYQLEKTSFSKYGTAYRLSQEQAKQEVTDAVV